MKNRIIWIRVDGNSQIGLGHLVRSFALAKMLASVFKVAFVCKDTPSDFISELNQNQFEYFKIDKESEFFELIKNNPIVVLDGYGFDTEYQKKIKELGARLVCIDDMHKITFFADLIINHAPNISVSDYIAQKYTSYALGLDYVLLRPIFLQKAREIRIEKEIDTAFICFGGSDNKNITQIVAHILKTYKSFKKINIVLGSCYNLLSELKRSVEDDNRFFFYHSVGSDIICDLISESQLAIVPASGILQEVLAIGGCKVISGTYVENQINIYQKYMDIGAFESAGNFSKEELKLSIDNVLLNKKIDHTKFIDGKSGERLLEIFIKLLK